MSKQVYAKNKKELARLIGISHPALLRLFERPDHPEQVLGKGWLIDQWIRYAKANIHYWKQRNGSNGSKHGPNVRDEAYVKRMELAAEKDQFDLDVKRGKYELKSDTRSIIQLAFGILTREGDKAFWHELPPRLEGLSAGQIAKLLGKRWEEIRERAAKSIESTNGHTAMG